MASKKTHDCEWRERATELEAKIAERDDQFAALMKRVNEIEQSLSVTKRPSRRSRAQRSPATESEAKATPRSTAIAPSDRALADDPKLVREPVGSPRPKKAAKPAR